MSRNQKHPIAILSKGFMYRFHLGDPHHGNPLVLIFCLDQNRCG
jgi:hypothetical protein